MLNSQDLRQVHVRIISKYSDEYAQNKWQTFSVDAFHVKDGLIDEIDHWHSNQPIFIEAQTGSGKTSLVVEELIPRAANAYKNVLILENRIAICSQQKHRVMKTIDDPRQSWFTEEGLRNVDRFGNTAIITYHRLSAFLKDKENQDFLSRVAYVICDEAHFFSSDAPFNSYTGHILRLITKNFRHAVRIYMSATGSDVLLPVAEAEQANYFDVLGKVLGQEKPLRLIRYVFPSDFSHHSVTFAPNLNTITEIIAQSNDKWLVFCDSKEDGKKYAGELHEIGKKTCYIDADSKCTPEWAEITSKEQFSADVLITTSVLDCGANICDSSVKHIVICSDNRTEFLQMLGRKRLKKGESVKLHVIVPSKKSLQYRYERTCKMLALIEEYANLSSAEKRRAFLTRIWERKDESMNLFFPYREDLFLNEVAEYSLRRRKMFYEQLINGELTFEQAVCSWMEKPYNSPCSYSTLADFYRDHGEVALNDTIANDLRRLIQQISEQAGYKEPQPTRLDTMKIAALNNRLKRLESIYEIIADSDGRWHLIQQNSKST